MRHMKKMTIIDIELARLRKLSQLSFKDFCEVHSLDRARFRSVVAAVNRFNLLDEKQQIESSHPDSKEQFFAEIVVESEKPVRGKESASVCVLKSNHVEFIFSELPSPPWLSEFFRLLQ